MISDQIQTTSKNIQFDKQAALTPATSQSIVFQPESYILHKSEGIQGQNETPTTLFRILQEKFQAKMEQMDEGRIMKQSNKVIIEENMEECDIKIGINIAKVNSGQVKKIIKNIIKTIQTQNQITLIFDKQHQKIKLQELQQYEININLQTSDNFCKNVWKYTFKIPENSKKWTVLKLSSPELSSNKFSFNIQLEKIGHFVIKPLSIKLPLSILDQFFDFKYKLLNKSDLLNEIQWISELKGILYPLTKQNMGSRIIQKLLSKATEDQIEQVISELKHHLKDMVVDRYGNYVVQKIFRLSNDYQRKICLHVLHEHIVLLLRSKQGTHCIQSVIQNLNSEQTEHWFLKLLPEQIILLSTNQYSMHFIIKLLSKVPLYNIYQVLLNDFKILSTDKYGIVVLKALLKIISSSQTMENLTIRYQFLNKLQLNFNQIAFTQYGHYIAEELFNYYSYFQLQNVLNYMTVYITYFSLNNYSSSIVRKAMQNYGDFFTVPVVNNLLSEGLPELMENSCGQFILHRLIELTQSQHHRTLLKNQMMILSQKVKCYEKRQKWLKFFKLA